jgi:hypothetical protein
VKERMYQILIEKHMMADMDPFLKWCIKLQKIMVHLTKNSSQNQPICDNCQLDQLIILDKLIWTWPFWLMVFFNKGGMGFWLVNLTACQMWLTTNMDKWQFDNGQRGNQNGHCIIMVHFFDTCH